MGDASILSISVTSLSQQLSLDVNRQQRDKLLNKGRDALVEVWLVLTFGCPLSHSQYGSLKGIAAAFKSLEPEVENAGAVHNYLLNVIDSLRAGQRISDHVLNNFENLAKSLDLAEKQMGPASLDMDKVGNQETQSFPKNEGH